MKLIKIFLTLFFFSILLNSCQKEYSVENGGLKLAAGNWEFIDSAQSYFGNMDTAYIVTTGTTKELHLDGTSDEGDQSFRMVLYADSFKTGAYKASLFQSSFNYSTTAKTIYQANQLVGEFLVTVTSLSSSLIEGTFSGTVKDTTNKLTQITQGKFKSTFGDAVTATPSSGVFGDSAGNCKPVVLSGVYSQGTAATALNTVRVQVVVAVAGTYSISTNNINGIIFSNTGTFTNTGSQEVILNAAGTPELPGEQVFTLHYGNSQCAFKVNFLPEAAPSGDYFPVTLNTNWTYGLEGGTPADSIFKQVINYSPAINGNSYNTITQSPGAGTIADDSSYFRKSGNDYYQYLNYANILNFDPPVSGEFIFLKDNVAENTTWQSPTVTGTVAGITTSVYVKMTLLAKAVPVSINNFDFLDVVKVKYEVFTTGNPLPLRTSERWFARNVGEIYTSVSDGVNTVQFTVGDYRIF